MIYPALNLLISQLNTYLAAEVEEPNAAVLGNVAMQDAGVNGKLVLTLVNIEEEKALKNSGPYHTYSKSNPQEVMYHNPPVHLNLFVLITATHTDYGTALQWISHTATFFQGKNVFTPQNATEYQNLNGSSQTLDDNFKLILDIYSPSLQEIMNIWTSLGGRHLPSIMYKVRLITVFRENVLQRIPPILTTRNDDKVAFVPPEKNKK
ncbi:DUF4255 domain-containing protein [Sphingobacteriales bacterium UPWRP_1]|nr:hypothetical protein BVG80_17755 [Sphingobacteriales bacterium TSM_CSM]PSJ74039.1 DUF4255 domain-containing protein [Sphingobacteriales bacterium UPWRP_1]